MMRLMSNISLVTKVEDEADPLHPNVFRVHEGHHTLVMILYRSMRKKNEIDDVVGMYKNRPSRRLIPVKKKKKTPFPYNIYPLEK